MSEQMLVKTRGLLDVGQIVFEPDPNVYAPARVWVDEDGRHVWIAHSCNDKRAVTMLPWPQWQAVFVGSGPATQISPSFVCEPCNTHVQPQIIWALSAAREGENTNG